MVEGARLEIDSARACQRTAKRSNAFPINDFRNNGVHQSVRANHGFDRSFGGYLTQF